jgi:hypothetical protein
LRDRISGETTPHVWFSAFSFDGFLVATGDVYRILSSKRISDEFIPLSLWVHGRKKKRLKKKKASLFRILSSKCGADFEQLL